MRPSALRAAQLNVKNARLRSEHELECERLRAEGATFVREGSSDAQLRRRRSDRSHGLHRVLGALDSGRGGRTRLEGKATLRKIAAQRSDLRWATGA